MSEGVFLFLRMHHSVYQVINKFEVFTGSDLISKMNLCGIVSDDAVALGVEFPLLEDGEHRG